MPLAKIWEGIFVVVEVWWFACGTVVQGWHEYLVVGSTSCEVERCYCVEVSSSSSVDVLRRNSNEGGTLYKTWSGLRPQPSN